MEDNSFLESKVRLSSTGTIDSKIDKTGMGLASG